MSGAATKTRKTIAPVESTPRDVSGWTWGLAESWRCNIADLKDAGGELDDVLEARLDALELEDARAVEEAIRAERWHEAQAKARRDEAERHAKAARSHEAKADAIRARLADLLSASGRRDAATPAGTVALRHGPPRVVIDDEASLPEDAWRVQRAPDKRGIKRRIDAGEDVPGAHVEDGDDYVVIK